MYKSVGRVRYRKLTLVAALTIFFGVFTAGCGLVTAVMFPEERALVLRAVPVGGVACVVGLVLLWRANVLIARYDPNSEQPDRRRSLAERHALALAAFDELQASRVRREYLTHLAALEMPRRSLREAEPKLLVIDWWVVPSLFTAGGTFTFRVTEADHVTVVVPEDTEPYAVLDVRVDSESVVPFKIRVVPMHVHPDELRLE
jgi:hypothetical protein